MDGIKPVPLSPANRAFSGSSPKPKVKIRIHKEPKRRTPVGKTASKTASASSKVGSKPIHPTQEKKSKSSKIKVVTISVAVGLSFLGGMYFMNSTNRSFAEREVLGMHTSSVPAGVVDANIGTKTELGQSTTTPSQNLLTMSLDQLENYLAGKSSDPEELKLQKRVDFLTVYLTKKKSPLVEFADVIASLKHWKIVLAISNSESSLGKKCADNNCSGIGVEPGHALWREYANKGEWAKDMDALIEKRYKDWSLEDMNGVYVQPGSENWVFAANQILEDLKGVE